MGSPPIKGSGPSGGRLEVEHALKNIKVIRRFNLSLKLIFPYRNFTLISIPLNQIIYIDISYYILNTIICERHFDAKAKKIPKITKINGRFERCPNLILLVIT